MKHVLVLGATGHLGKVIVTTLLEKNYTVTALVRNPEKINTTNSKLTIIKGDVTKKEDLMQALNSIDVVISALGHGFRTSYLIQEKTLTALIPLMDKMHISRFITITGAALPVVGDQQSHVATISYAMLSLIDPYRMKDAEKQQILLEKSTLNWTVVRTPVHNSSTTQKITHVGYSQPNPLSTLSRNAIATFMVECIEEKKYDKKSPIIY